MVLSPVSSIRSMSITVDSRWIVAKMQALVVALRFIFPAKIV